MFCWGLVFTTVFSQQFVATPRRRAARGLGTSFRAGGRRRRGGHSAARRASWSARVQGEPLVHRCPTVTTLSDLRQVCTNTNNWIIKNDLLTCLMATWSEYRFFKSILYHKDIYYLIICISLQLFPGRPFHNENQFEPVIPPYSTMPHSRVSTWAGQSQSSCQ